MQKKIEPKKYKNYLIISFTLIVLGIILLIIQVNFITVVVFNLFQSFGTTIIGLIYGVHMLNLSNHKAIKDAYKVEYFTMFEFNNFIGRIIGYVLFIILGFSFSILFNSIILFTFAVLIIIYGCLLIDLHNVITKEENKEEISYE